jgi:hypothetical protein
MCVFLAPTQQDSIMIVRKTNIVHAALERVNKIAINYMPLLWKQQVYCWLLWSNSAKTQGYLQNKERGIGDRNEEYRRSKERE